MTDRAEAWLDARDKSKPFLLWLHYMEPHSPYDARDEASKGASEDARYESELRYVDREIGRLLDGLRTRGGYDDTIVVLFGDHGEEFGEHGGRFHGTSVYEEQVRVPLCVRAPKRSGVVARADVETVVSLLDVAPTLLDVLGVASPAPMMGRSLRPALLGEPLETRPVFMECSRFGRSHSAVVEWPYKMIVDPSVRTTELYDLAQDPGERDNLLERDPAEARRLMSLLAAVPRGAGAGHTSTK